MKYLMLESKFRSIPYRFPSSRRTRSRRPWFHSPCHRGSCSHPPSPHRSSSSRPPKCRPRTRLVPARGCRGWGTRRTGRPRCSARSNLQEKRLPQSKSSFLCSFCCRRCLRTNSTEASGAFSEKQEQKAFCDLWFHAWPRYGCYFRYSNLHGHFVF